VDGVDGKVIETSWRATQLLNSFGNVVTVPNTLAAKVKIVNLSRPDSFHGVSVILHISPEARPMVVIDALHRALTGCDLALTTPAPSVAATSTDANSISYELTCYVSELSQTQVAKNQLFDLAFRHLSAAQVGLRPLGYPTPTANGVSSCEMLLARVEIFKSFSSAEITALAELSVRCDFEAGASLATETDVTDFLMVVASGVLSIKAKDTEGKDRLIIKLGPGDSLGEAGVLAGIPLGANVIADTGVTVYKLSKSALTPFLKSNPAIAKNMCAIIAKRKNAADITLRVTEQTSSTDGLFHRIWQGMQNFHVMGD
jgi:CRP-like cAMP-binding protein